MYLNGVTIHTSTARKAPVAGLRGDCAGWTPATAGRQKKWLYSVSVPALDGVGLALTLTLRDCPPTAEEWARMRSAWLKRIGRKWPVLRVHWVTEWQKRMVPHMHCAVYLRESDRPRRLAAELVTEWQLVCDAFGYESSWRSQDAKLIEDVGGWFKYMSKHAARGANHYQRKGHPEGWDKTGRMWGYTGDWIVSEPIDLEHVSRQDFYTLRRTLRHWARNQAAAKHDWARLSYLRAAPGRIPADRSRFQAASEWISEPEMLRLLDYLGYQ